MLISHLILAMLVLPLANSCDKEDCQTGVSVGAGVCAAVAGVGGAAAAATTCAATAWFTFGLSCAAAGITYAAVVGGCTVAGVTGREACRACAADYVPDFEDIANELDGIKINQVENHLEQVYWFRELYSNDKEIILNQGKMIALQNTALEQLDQLIIKTENLENRIEQGHIISLYGQDIIRIKNVRNKFKLLTREASGIIRNDYRAQTFKETAAHDVFGLESSINNIFLMLRGGLIIKPESIYEALGDEFCGQEVHRYFLNLQQEALIMFSIALAMEGHSLSPQFKKQFNQDVVKATSAFVKHCGCPYGLIAYNRGKVSTLLDRLPYRRSSSYSNIEQAESILNENTRNKVFEILELKDYDVNEDTIKIINRHSREDISIISQFTKNDTPQNLEFHDCAKVCIDEDMNEGMAPSRPLERWGSHPGLETCRYNFGESGISETDFSSFHCPRSAPWCMGHDPSGRGYCWDVKPCTTSSHCPTELPVCSGPRDCSGYGYCEA